MKRYMVFQCNQYYPSGGLDDVTGDFDTVMEARNTLRKVDNYHDYSNIFDRIEGISIE